MSNSRILLWAMSLLFAGAFPILDFLSEPPKAQGEDKKSAAEPKTGEEREFEIATGVKMSFCWIPPGEAQLGSPKAEREAVEKDLRDAAEKFITELQGEPEDKRGTFKTKGFWLGKNPVTQAEWKAVMGDNPSFFQPDGKGKEQLQKDKILETSHFPVEWVSWDDCQQFLEKVNKRGGAAKVFGKAGKFVLPHEDQWEFACRGGKGNKQAFYFGNELNGTQANCKGNAPYGTDKKGDYKERTTEVGSYAKDRPHPWGLCDMHGNVFQWCDNKYDKTDDRILRGGSWDQEPVVCRAAFRNWQSAATRYIDFGLRVCFSLEK